MGGGSLSLSLIHPPTHPPTHPSTHPPTHRVSTSNALAAHLWPLLTPLLTTPGGKEEGGGGGVEDSSLTSLRVIVNYRKALPTLGPMYYGNCVGMKVIDTSLPLLPDAQASAQMEKTLPSLTRLALKIRKGVVVTGEATNAYLEEAHYLQKALEEGKIGSVTFGMMRDVAEGKPLLLWDDVSGFQPGGMGTSSSSPLSSCLLAPSPQASPFSFPPTHPPTHSSSLQALGSVGSRLAGPIFSSTHFPALPWSCPLPPGPMGWRARKSVSACTRPASRSS